MIRLFLNKLDRISKLNTIKIIGIVSTILISVLVVSIFIIMIKKLLVNDIDENDEIQNIKKVND